MEATPWLTCRAKLHRRRTGNRWQGAATSTSAAGCLLRRCLCTSYMGEAEFGWALYSSSSPDFRPQSLPAGFAHLAAYHPAHYYDDANRAREALSHRLVDFVTLGLDFVTLGPEKAQPNTSPAPMALPRQQQRQLVDGRARVPGGGQVMRSEEERASG